MQRYAAALGALLLTSAALSPAHAMQASAPDSATRAAMDKRTAARTLLSSALARIAANSSDASALRDAGRASIELEDYRAALGFLVRAEQAAPRDGTVKAALGSAMVHMENPTRALDYFGEAQLLGAPERTFLSDRGLARDLLGQQDAAQRDYQLALSVGPNDEITRRYALSLGISGDADRAVQLLTPQLRAQDRGAWRLRAMILAMNGRDKEATEIVNATMPAALAQNILPYLTQLDRLNPAQQAAAAHFGRFPEGNLGPKRKPVQVAAATPAPTPAPAASDRSRGNRDRARSGGVVLPAPVARKGASVTPAQPAPGWAAETKPQQIPPRTAAPAAVTPAPSQPAPGWAVEAKPQPQPQPQPVPAPAPGWAAEAKPPTATSGSASTGSQLAAAPPSQSSVPPANRPALEATTLAQTPAAVTALPPAAASPGKIGVAMNPDAGPVGPGYSIADTATPPATASIPTAAPAPAPAPVPPPAAAAPLASLADIVGSIEIPPEELNGPDNAIGAATLAKLLDDKRRAEAAEAVKREKDALAAKAKAEADAKAKAEAAEKKASPARSWVQIAAGANARALATDYGKFARKSPDLFKGKSGGIVEWGRINRLLVGPFKDRKAAQDWLANYKKAGGDGLPFNSEAGQSVDPVK